MRTTPCRSGWLLVVALALPTVLPADQTEVYRAVGLETKDILSGTVVSARVAATDSKQVVCLTTYFTGKTEKSTAINIRLDIFERQGETLVPLYSRDFGQENGGYLADGNLELLDLDQDGLQEIIVSYESYKNPLIEQRVAEVILFDGVGFRTGWTGPMEYDATRAARDVPPERRDRFRRRFDFEKTMRSRGMTLFVRKEMIAVAGERLQTPQIVEEAFPLRSRRTRR